LTKIWILNIMKDNKLLRLFMVLSNEDKGVNWDYGKKYSSCRKYYKKYK